MSAPEPQVLVTPDADALVEGVAERLRVAVARALSQRAEVHVVLTGGRVAGRVLAALGGSAGARSLEWQRVHLWWGDERFLPAGDPDRNETQAREQLDGSGILEAAVVHPMPASDGPDGPDAEAAARRYAADLAHHTGAGDRVAGALAPAFDVLLLGVGPDGHVASLFPGHESLTETSAAVVAEHGSPKPPPVRLSLTLPVLTAAREVWMVVSGEDKADAVARGLAGDDVRSTPAAGVHGTEATWWLLDEAAASRR